MFSVTGEVSGVASVQVLSEIELKSKRFSNEFAVPRVQVASLSQRGRSTSVERACERFSIESASCVPEAVHVDRRHWP